MITSRPLATLEAAEQIENMMVLDPYPGFEAESWSVRCRNVLPKPRQKPPKVMDGPDRNRRHPISSKVDSLNVGHAAAITLAAVSRN